MELKLSQQLQETKKELEKERESFRAELNERETRERALEANKRQLEIQLTAVDRENYESLEELSLLQVCTMLVLYEFFYFKILYEVFLILLLSVPFVE